MDCQRSLKTLAAAVAFAHLLNAAYLLHANPIAASSPEPWVWRSESEQCKTRITESNCIQAVAQICDQDLKQLQNATRGDCSALYWYDTKTVEPTKYKCYKEFARIIRGGALGYDADGNRTNSPVYVVTPTNGNGNCLKAPKDSSPVLAPDQLPNNHTLNTTCPVSSSRRKRMSTNLEAKEYKQDQCGDHFNLEQLGCTAMCLLSVTTTSWE